MQTLSKAHLTFALKILLATGLIYWLIHKKAIDFDVLMRISSPGPLLLCLALTTFGILLNNYRWLLLLRAKSCPTTFSATTILSFIGIFWNFAMPGGVGGDVVKAYYLLKDHPEKKMDAMTTVLMDRFIGLFAMLLTSTVVCLAEPTLMHSSPALEALRSTVLLVFAIFLVLIAIAFSPWLKRKGWIEVLTSRLPFGHLMKQLYEAVHYYGTHWRLLIKTMVLSFIAQLSTIACFIVVASVMGESIPLSAYFFIVPLGIMTTALPLSPAGVGVGQAAFYILFKIYLGRESTVGATTVTLIQVLQFGIGLLGAYFYFRRRSEMVHEAQPNG